MLKKKGVFAFGLIEIGIGTTTLFATINSLLQGFSTKPPNVLTFVVLTSAISISLGVGILLRSYHARKWLVFFAAAIILTKIMILGDILTLNGELETSLPSNLKSLISILYHSLVVIYFRHPRVRKEYTL